MTMKKNLLLYILLAFLVVMNGFFLFKHFGTSNTTEPRRGSPKDFIAKQLEFDEAQMVKFEEIDAEHRKKVNAIQIDIKRAKDVLFDKISDTAVTSSIIDSLAADIAKNETRKELEIFSFFKAIGTLCTSEQKVRFESIIKDALRRGPQGQNRPPPRGMREEGRPPPPGGPGEEGRPPPPRD